jgi:Beta-propeller repeat
MFRSVLLAALVLTKILSAAPMPQPFHQPLVFEPNRGQVHAQATWIAHGPGYQLQLTDDAALMTFRERASGAPRVLKMKLAGSGSWNHVEALEPTVGVSNYINRPKGATSITGVPHYSRLKISNVYQGIDLVFYNDAGNLEYDFVLQPGADAKQIQVAFEGQRDLRLDYESGDLILTTPSGSELRQISPKVYQQMGDRRVAVAGGYKLLSDGRFGFTLAAYNPQHPLTIDPAIQLVQFLGNLSQGRAIAVDTDGNSYVTGSAGVDFPVTNGSQYQDGVDHSFWTAVWNVVSVFWEGIGFQATLAGFYTPNVFVTKLSTQGTILFSTYGGLGAGSAIAVDSTGVVVTGWRTDDPNVDIKLGTGLFAWKLSLTGNQLYYSPLNGADTDTGTSVALDSQHNAWIAGVTSATYLTGAQQETPYALALKVNPQGVFTDRKTFGGSFKDFASGVAVDLDDNPWFTGQTCSRNFPASPGFDYRKGKCAIFVLKLIHQSGPATTKFVTVFGGGESDGGASIAVNANREAYVTGLTNSQVFYTSQGAYQVYPIGYYAQGFITQLDGFGHFIHSTLLGSNGDTAFNTVALNAAGEVYVGGATTAASFPQNGPVVAHPTAGIIAKLSPDLSTLFYSRQEGIQVNGVALQESVPAVTSTQIFSTGTEYFDVQDPRAFVTKLNDDIEYTRLRNYWIGDQYINIESGAAKTSQIAPGWLSAQWEFDLQPTTNGDPAGAKVFWIRNRGNSDQYLNIESGNLQSSPIGPGWLSARWTLEPINGTNLYRIRNVWQPDKCLNIESGALRASPVEPDWWSSWWVFDRVF